MNPVFTKAYKAAAAISAYQIVKLDANGLVVPASAAADKAIGVSGAVATDVDAHTDVHRLGIVNVQLGGAVAIGAEVTSNAQGFGVAATAAGNESIGRAEQAGVAGDIIEVFLRLRTL
jgi:hypothetical protein